MLVPPAQPQSRAGCAGTAEPGGSITRGRAGSAGPARPRLPREPRTGPASALFLETTSKYSNREGAFLEIRETSEREDF